jgi:hypothetical protein
MKKVGRENSKVLKTENDIYTNNNFKPEFKTLMSLTKGSMFVKPLKIWKHTM